FGLFVYLTILSEILTQTQLYKATFSGYFESDEEATSQTGQKSIKGKLQQDDTQENVECRNFVWVELSPGLQYDISESIEKEIAFIFEKDYGYSQKNVIIAPINLFY
ncbi:hypothetical protein, partial [Proteiniclasticum ruminis]|uniref:hypothetical protein n=1 Tax=Proteiniclasticum ruminis TaxID=398199 RepID=UPI0028A11215